MLSDLKILLFNPGSETRNWGSSAFELLKNNDRTKIVFALLVLISYARKFMVIWTRWIFSSCYIRPWKKPKFLWHLIVLFLDDGRYKSYKRGGKFSAFSSLFSYFKRLSDTKSFKHWLSAAKCFRSFFVFDAAKRIQKLSLRNFRKI